QAAGMYVYAGNEVGAHFATQHGFRPVSTNTLLRAAGDAAWQRSGLPPGYTLRLYSALGDPATLIRAMNEGYAGQWGHHTVSEDMLGDWGPELLGAEPLLLYNSVGNVVGICRVERADEAVAYIDAPGVVPELRGSGLHEPLLLAALAYLDDRASAARR